MKNVLITTNQLHPQLSSRQKKLRNNGLCVGIKLAGLDITSQQKLQTFLSEKCSTGFWTDSIKNLQLSQFCMKSGSLFISGSIFHLNTHRFLLFMSLRIDIIFFSKIYKSSLVYLCLYSARQLRRHLASQTKTEHQES